MLAVSKNQARLTVLLALTVILAALCTLKPIGDPDFWYHISAGKYMTVHHTLITEDPFSYTTYTRAAPDASTHADNLRGYWLAQALMYMLYAGLGPYGIIAARVAIYGATCALVLLWAIKKGSSPLAASALMILGAIFLGNYTGDRPQIASFALAPLALYIMERHTGEPRARWPFAALPVVMMLWANLHRGYPMGAALIALYATVEALRGDKARLKGLMLISALSVSATLINPNGYATYMAMIKFEGSPLQRVILEYRPTLETGAYGITLWPYIAYIALAFMSLIAARRGGLRASEVAVAVALGVLSFKAFRYVPFFLLCALPAASVGLTAMLRSRIPSTLPAVALMLLASAYAAYGNRADLQRLSSSGLIPHRYPEAAVRQIEKLHPSGPLYNEWTWGGYLMWELPQYKVFADTRTLNLQALRDYAAIGEATPKGIALLDSYGIKTVLIAGLNDFTGALAPLFEHLIRDPHWSLIYYDETSVIFIRGDEALAARASMPSAYAYEHVIDRAAIMAPVSPPAVREALEAQALRARAEIARLRR